MLGEPPSPQEASPPAGDATATPPSSLPERQPRRRSALARFWASKQRRWTAIGVASMFLISFIAGIAYYWSHQGAASDEEDYVEVYVTDLPANFTRLEVRLAGVYVGDPNYTLELLEPRFDLLSLRGPEDALKIAQGYVPSGDHQAIRIVFQSARAMLNGAWIAIQLPEQVLTVSHDFNTRENPKSAFLFDIDVEHSIEADENGLVFRPRVDAIFFHSFEKGVSEQIASGSPVPGGLGTPVFRPDSKQAPRDQDLGKSTGSLTPSKSSSPPVPTNTKFTWVPPEPTRTTATTSGHASPTTSREAPPTTSSSQFVPPTDTEGYLPSPGDAASVPEDPLDLSGWFVRFNFTKKLADDMWNVIVESVDGEIESGPRLVFAFGSEAAAYVFATPEMAWQMSQHPDVLYVEADQRVVLNMDSSRQAIRLPQVVDPLLGLKDASGLPLDGKGVSVGVIDIGFDGTHPDLPHRLVQPLDYLMETNYKVESLFTIDAPNTDLTSGHGTHVLGILAGRSLDPSQKGVAPGARVYGFAIGEASTTLWPNTALDWLVQNHDKVDPPIKVVTNSWGSGNRYDPNSLTTRLIERLIDEGVTVVFSAGNAGGDGSLAATTSQCQIPKPGLICVGAYDDADTGTRDGAIASYSSRGRVANASTWPDVAAPGSHVRSARPLAGSVTGTGLIDAYTKLDGTSMAAPHVAGIVALMLQANPNLSPAQVESILEQSAYKFSAGGAYTAFGHHAKGHGLADAYAAIALAKAS